MVKKFCFLCGKPAAHEGYCEKHWGEKNPLIKLPEKIEIIQCPKCDLMKKGHKWVQPNHEKIIKDKAKLRGEVDEWIFTPKNDDIEVEVSGWINGRRKEERHLIKIKIVKNICPICGRLLGGYYETKLQIRGDFTGTILEWIENETERMRKRDKKAFFRHELLKSGVDYYFGSKSAAKKIVAGLKKKYDVEIKESFKIWGRKDGKEVKRTIIAVRFKGKFKPVPNI